MIKRHLILLLTVSALLGCSRHSFPTQTTPAAVPTTHIDGRYKARHLETAAGLLPYRVAHLNPDSLPGKPALVLYLHSANGRGADNILQFQRQKAIDSIYNYMVAHRMNVLFLIPQCPADHHWSGNRNLPSYLEPVKELLKLYADSTDRQHTYLFGASMGGGGTWRLLNELPNTFAAAFVASGTYHDNDPAVLASTPLYCTIGSEEEEWRINNLQSLTNHIQQNGGEVMFDILPGLNHPQTCEQSFTAERIGWVFGHERR